MKSFTALFLGLILSAGISLGQEADTSSATTEIQQVQEAVPVVAKTTECLDKKWVIGFEATSLDLKALPGTVFLQRKISSKYFVGAGFSCDYYNDKPGEDYNAEDSTRYNYENKNWRITLSPEIGYMALNGKMLAGGVSVRANLSRSRNTSVSENRTERYYYYYSTYYSESNSFNYDIGVPVFVEKQFKIRKYPVAVGIANNFIGLSGGWYKYCRKYTNESYWSPTLDVDEDESTRKQPMVFNLDNPFQGYVKVFFKVYI
ncbi:MAG: hypothetical protein KJ620_00045 [Candidatus Edwardsbacteria bacterium]|nr:hypothetical protein [Candidatus Edwardsbacteria bacterium]MBU1577161.1 hypothetical protein [Candidatus Edwardsbacteria bacterium]MBU2464423.1 hypothetical protein [Candidatus Edwardsbacteria bacterium]MBU2593302.1 hypothetical protein [Candidatus Edwardsbacteria bacterium]